MQYQYPICFSHIGLSVPDISEAIRFYKEVFGWYHLAGPLPIQHGTIEDEMYDNLFGKGWPDFKLAHMSTGDRIGIKLFEFDGNDAGEWTFKKNGVSHFGLLANDVKEFIRNLEAHGGKQRSVLVKKDLGNFHTTSAYCSDPFGNIFEVYSHSYELMSQG